MSGNRSISIEDLPNDVILAIFSHFSVKSLCTVALVCHRFKELSSSNSLWRKWADHCIFTSSEYGLNYIRCPSFKEQCRLSKRWTQGRGRVIKLLRFEKNYLPWLALDSNRSNLYLAQGDHIKQFSVAKLFHCKTKGNENTSGITNALKYSVLKNAMEASILVHKDADICRFTVSDDWIVSGGWHGKLSWISTTNQEVKTKEKAHGSKILAVDVDDRIVVTGSVDNSYKIWRFDSDGSDLELQSSVVVNDTVLSTAINKYESTFAVGSGGLNGIHPLQVKDLASGRHLYSLGSFLSYKRGAGVLDCHYQSPNLLMSAGYDTYVRLWDTRVSTCKWVSIWEEPHDNTVYCVASDNRYGFVTGSCRHGVVRVWDTRLKYCLQTFYLGDNVSSPVYTLQLTHSHLFAGLARGLFVLDFR